MVGIHDPKCYKENDIAWIHYLILLNWRPLILLRLCCSHVG